MNDEREPFLPDRSGNDDEPGWGRHDGPNPWVPRQKPNQKPHLPTDDES